MAQRPFIRTPAPPKAQRYQRRHRERRETDVWKELVEEVGTPASTGLLVHVGDRGADMLPFFRGGLSTHPHFVVRAAQNRRVRTAEDEIGHLLDQVRAWPSQDQHSFEVPARHGQPTRQTMLQLSFGPATVLPPWNDPRGSTDPLPVWMVRVWETEPPAGTEALEWILVTSLHTQTCEQAWQRTLVVSLSLDRRRVSSVPQNWLSHRAALPPHAGALCPVARTAVSHGCTPGATAGCSASGTRVSGSAEHPTRHRCAPSRSCITGT
jgi:hypothetical protein